MTDRAGWSASAEGGRARRAHRWRRLVNAVGAVVATGLAASGFMSRDPRLLVGAVAIGLVGWRARPVPDPDRWARGSKAEVATADLLSALPRRFVVLHDRGMPGRRGNIDHLVIGRSGVWVVDTKVRRAPLRIRGGQVWAGEHVIDPGPAARQADAVSKALTAPVGAVIAVHGQGLRGRGKVVAGVRIIPADRLRRRLRRGRRLSRAAVAPLAVRVDQLFPSRR